MNDNSTQDDRQHELVNAISLQVGCPLPCMGHEETERTYTEILDIVTPLIREQVAQEIANAPRRPNGAYGRGLKVAELIAREDAK